MQVGLFSSLREWVLLVGVLVAAGSGAAVLWFLGYGAFEWIPITFPGYLIGFLLADLLTRISWRRWRTVLLLTFAWVLSLLLYFVVSYEWLYRDSGFFSDSRRTAIYWLMQGTVLGLAVSSGVLSSLIIQGYLTPQEARKRTKNSVRRLLSVLGAVVSVFVLLFMVYVLLEYVLGPVLRLFL